jgi:iron complex outermembrane receptor protein
MKRVISALSKLLVLFFFFVCSANALAETENGKQDDKRLAPGPGEVFMNIGEVVVTEQSDTRDSVDLPGSVDILGEDQIEKEVTSNALELLRRIPGFIYNDYGNGGVPNGFTMRGFYSNHGSDNLVLIDGIPINDHFWQEDGAPDLNQLTSEEIERIEVIKGPIDARYGNWARAGIVNYQTRNRGDFLKSKLTLGSWNTHKAYVSGGTEELDGKFNQIYSAEYYSTDAWRDNSQQERQNAYAKWYYRPVHDLQLGVQAHVYKGDWYTGSYITEDQWRQNPRSAFDASQNDGGQKELGEVSLHLDWNPNGRVPVEARLWYKDNSASRYADWGSGQTESYTEESVIGALANVGYNLDLAAGSRLRLDAGFDFRTFDSDVQNWQTDARSREGLTSDKNYVFNNLGLYLKANYDPMEYIRLFAGVRHDNFTGDTFDHRTGEARDMDDYDITTYKGGIIGNLGERYSIYANVGTTYTLPKKDEKYDENHKDIKDLLFWEAGLKANPFDWMLLRYAYYNSEEDVYDEISGVDVHQGDAIRKGHEVELSLLPLEGLTVFTSLTRDDSKYDGGEKDGKWVTSVPEYIWKMGLQYDSAMGTGGRIWYTDVGRWYTDDTNEHSYEGYHTTDVGIYHTFAEKWTVSFDVKNLFDENYAEFVGFWSGANQYMSSNPRAYYLSLRFDG